MIRRGLNRLLAGLGVPSPAVISPPDRLASGAVLEEAEVVRFVQPFTLTSPERIVALIDAVRHVAARGIPGAIVECGVWRGGSMMAAAHSLLRLGESGRDLYLFDTFSGMSEPTDDDVSPEGESMAKVLRSQSKADPRSTWCTVGLAEVRRNLALTRYPDQRLHFIAGRVEETVPREAPAAIALLRLDTDWYESTRHELVHLYPRLSPGGILIVDDYGHFPGARRAVEEYFAETGRRPFLTRIDYTGRIGVKES